MTFYHHQAETNSYFSGQVAGPHSHNYLPQQASTSHLPVLDGVGALFFAPSVLRKGSRDENNSHFDDDEAFSLQADTNESTPPADHTAQMYSICDGDHPGPRSPLTPRGTPVHGLPYLPPEEIPELRRQRAARMKSIIALDYYQPALEDTPKHSPVDTNFTSVDAGSEHDSVYHEHSQGPSWGYQTPSNRSIESEYDNESGADVSGMEYNVRSSYYLPAEYTYSAVDALGYDATQLAGLGHADDAAL